MHACMLSHFSRVQLCVTPWTAAHQAPLSTGFSRQEYWSGLPFPSPREIQESVDFAQMTEDAATILSVRHEPISNERASKDDVGHSKRESKQE